MVTTINDLIILLRRVFLLACHGYTREATAHDSTHQYRALISVACTGCVVGFVLRLATPRY